MHSDDVKNFALIDALGATQDPPNTISMTVTAVSQSDRVAVFRLDGTAGEIIKEEYYASASVNLITNTVFVVSGAIDTDVPKESSLWIYSGSLTDTYKYTTWANDDLNYSGSFTISGSGQLSQSYEPATPIYIPIIDEIVVGADTTATNTLVQSATIPVLIRVRQKGIIPFEIESTIISTGRSIAAIRTEDTIVTA